MPPPGWTPDVVGCCGVTDVFRFIEEAEDIWHEGRTGPGGSDQGFEMHCYVCCKMRECTGGCRWGAFAQSYIEGWGYRTAPDYHWDNLACNLGGIVGESLDCETACNIIGFILNLAFDIFGPDAIPPITPWYDCIPVPY